MGLIPNSLSTLRACESHLNQWRALIWEVTSSNSSAKATRGISSNPNSHKTSLAANLPFPPSIKIRLGRDSPFNEAGVATRDHLPNSPVIVHLSLVGADIVTPVVFLIGAPSQKEIREATVCFPQGGRYRTPTLRETQGWSTSTLLKGSVLATLESLLNIVRRILTRHPQYSGSAPLVGRETSVGHEKFPLKNFWIR